jgi:hypothetical protein
MSTREQHARCPGFGDFQTPLELASEICRLVSRRRFKPASIFEPSCGTGHFLLAALDQFPAAGQALGVEINPAHACAAIASLRDRGHAHRASVIQASFFDAGWAPLLCDLAEPIAVVGNPPWVTNSELGALGSANVPIKSNFQNRSGLEAMTGKSNFDISEWMLITLVDRLAGRKALVAMLCKTAVARKVLVHAWTSGVAVRNAEIRRIDAAKLFGVSVDACVFLFELATAESARCCRVYRRLHDDQPARTVGFHDGRLIADAAAYERTKNLEGQCTYRWRSGVKHDASAVMELRQIGSSYVNGLGEDVDIEDVFLFPMFKGSELARGPDAKPTRWMLVTQISVADDTSKIQAQAPKTWAYLLRHGHALDRRASAIYRNRPRFSLFGVGDYTFAPWKVAISGFHKRLRFAIVGSFGGKPIVLDDTCCFLACRSEGEARRLASLLNSPRAQDFFTAFVFWDAKRPITIELLRRLDLAALARNPGTGD